MTEADKIIIFISGLAFHLFVVGVTSKYGSVMLHTGTEFENNAIMSMQLLALGLLLSSWIIVQTLPKTGYIVLANLAFSVSAVIIIFLVIGFRVAYTTQTTPQHHLIIAFYSLSALLSLLSSLWNLCNKL